MSNKEEQALEIVKDVKKIIAEQLGVDEARVVDSASFGEDLGADSLDTVELVLALEEHFRVEIPDEEAQKLLTVKEVLDYIVSTKTTKTTQVV